MPNLELSFLNRSLRHNEWRKLAKKARRKRIRQALATTREDEEQKARKLREASPSHLEQLSQIAEQEAFQEQEEARLSEEANKRWLEVEAEAQKQWVLLQAKVQEARDERARQNTLIRVEWEHEQTRLKTLQEAKEKEREVMEAQQQKLVEELDNFIAHGGSTPEQLKARVEMNPAKPLCPFFQKTGACRFRDTCSRNHIKPAASRILLLSNFYTHYSLDQGETEHGDSSLEFENDETYAHFREFFNDVLPEMEAHGRVRQFKVCCNHEAHLRGNVYVEYSTTREAVRSFRVFNGRWYGGKQLNVEFCDIESWKSAICGLFFRGTCPKGNACNFLHVFRNPRNMFHTADKDMHRTPPRKSIEEASERRNWRWSESPEVEIRPKRHRKHSRSRERSKRHRHSVHK